MDANDDPAALARGDAPITKGEAHIRFPKAAHDLILLHPKPRDRAQLLVVMIALLRAENDTRRLRGETFAVKICELARLSGLSAGSIDKCLRILTGLGLLAVASGKFERRQNSFRILQSTAPPRRALASAPTSLAEISDYVSTHNLDISEEIRRIFWQTNESRDWLIAGKDGSSARPCNDWRKLLIGFAKLHRQLNPLNSVPDPSTTTVPVGQTRRSKSPRTESSYLRAKMPSHITERMLRINPLIGRTDETLWMEKEMTAFHSAGIDILPPEEFDDHMRVLRRYYLSPFYLLKDFWQEFSGKDFRRKKLVTLLQNWSEEVDKARKFVGFLIQLEKEEETARTGWSERENDCTQSE